MKTNRGKQPADYLGADLTDRHSRGRRAIDVCGLICAEENRLRAAFWQWKWPAPQGNLDISSIAPEIRNAKSTMLDGPQGLASISESMRACERQSGAVGKTPDSIPALGRPFTGYIRSSIELFSAFAQGGFKVSPTGFTGGCPRSTLAISGGGWPSEYSRRKAPMRVGKRENSSSKHLA
jgi:hypothetical protein